MIQNLFEFLSGLLIKNKEIISILGDVATTATIVFLFLERLFSRRTYRYNCEWQEKNKAVELAALYKNEILNSNSYITYLFDRLGIIQILKHAYHSDLELFTRSELDEFLSQADIECIREILKNPDNYSVFLEGQSRYVLEHRGIQLLPQSELEKMFEKDEEKIREFKTYLMQKQYYDVLDHLLNSLEYFAMYFNTGVADEKVVYQSLHQTYLRLVRALYFEIALRNDSPKDMYYTNIINLYITWSRRDEKMKNKLQRQNLRIVNNARKIKK